MLSAMLATTSNTAPLLQLSGDSRVSFGLTSDSFVIGYMTNTTLNGGSLKLTQLIEGAGWIVRG